MNMRKLGRSDICVPPVCIGGNVFGWTADADTSFAILDRLHEAGLNFIDTADAYSIFVPGHVGGESETVIGDWMASRGVRDGMVIATKVGAPMGRGRQGLSRAYIERAVEDSLRRLRTDYIDLYQSHRDDAETPLEETLAAFDALIGAGKVRIIGASNFEAERLAAAESAASVAERPRYEVVQPHYNLHDREAFEAGVQPFCLTHEVSAICYYGLAHGFLSGKYRRKEDVVGRPRAAPLAAYFNPRGEALLAALDEIAAARGTTHSAIALSWLAAQPGVASAIASVTSVVQADALVVAARLELSADERSALDDAGRTPLTDAATTPV